MGPSLSICVLVPTFKTLCGVPIQACCLQALIIMSKPLGHPDVDIPSVFVSRKTGIIMQQLMTPGATVAIILPVSAQP